ncbi:MAG: nucleotidyltransferase family protein [Terriglobales bacterium]|jgi:NDP-sugar pyrophosphorylase family protein
MKAMILAAGLGTRLLPLTEDRPKALVQLGGRTLLEIALLRLRELGIREVIVNVHHFAAMVIEYLRSNEGFGMRIEVSREETLLDTGGALKQAGWFFLADPASDEPFLLHNVDVIHAIDLARMVHCHEQRGALATLAVQQRASSRYLLFNEEGELCGRRLGRDGSAQMARVCERPQARAFSGVHVISPRLLAMMTETGAFSIVDLYLRLAAQAQKIVAFRTDGSYWRDVGTPQNLAEAEEDARQQLVNF